MLIAIEVKNDVNKRFIDICKRNTFSALLQFAGLLLSSPEYQHEHRRPMYMHYEATLIS